jgi:ATP-dependent Zn protease
MRFSAFWDYISKNNLNNPTIYSLKEYANSSNIYDDYGEPRKKNKILKMSKNKTNNFDNISSSEDEDEDNYIEKRDIFIVEQPKHFKIKSEIYCKVYKHIDRNSNEDSKKQYDMEQINIEIYSYTLSLKQLTNFVDNITQDYIDSLEKSRKNKKFIYTLTNTGNDDNNSYDRETIKKWDECIFKSTRNFNNLFFSKKEELLKKLDFFINNKSYYLYEGHPYTFGIGLHGPPGTGKTSVIKCIANKLNRHIIVIPLSKIKTQSEFSEYFFEKYYRRENTQAIDFKHKIIVFEDIDCMSDIVKKRNINNKNNNKNNNKKSKVSNSDSDNDGDVNADNEILEKSLAMQNKLLNKIAKKVDNEHVGESVLVDIDKSKDDKITLSFILNLIDGLRETPGRILIITSNDYESLDPALIRPGRIDLTLEMNNADVNTIQQMYKYYYNCSIPKNIVNNLRDDVLSPAKLVNMRLQNQNKEDFLSNLEYEFSK